MFLQFRKWGVAALAACLLLCCLPLTALADGDPAAGSLALRTAKDPDDSNDKAVYYAVPEALPGESLSIYVPLQCTGTVTNVTCEANASQFPAELETPSGASGFQASAIDSATPIPTLTDAKAYFSFPAKVASTAAAGDYTLIMTVQYMVNGAPASPLTLSMAFKVKAAPAPTPTPTPGPSTSPTATPEVIDEVITYDSGSSGSSGGSSYRSKPKVIVESYAFDAEKLYAGEQVTLSLRLRNTSTREAVRNLELKFSNEAGVIMPVSGGSNSIYIGELKKNSGVNLQIPLSLAPEAEAKAQSIALEIVYEGTRNKQEFTEKSSITAPIYQRARVRTDAPQVYDEAWVGQTVSMSVQMFNMGKSTLYNCMVEVEGEGLSLEETYYGGNVASGGTMRADLTLQTAVAGDIDGTVCITYEDVFGEQSEERLPFTVTVNEEMPMPEFDPAMAEVAGTPEPASGILRYWWVALIVLLTVAVLVLLSLYRRKRARLLSDDVETQDAAEGWEQTHESAPDALSSRKDEV